MENSSQNIEIMNKLSIIFEEVQRSKQFHKQQLTKLKSILKNETNDDIDGNKRISFMILILKGCLDKTLVVSKKNEPNVDRVINFICDFVLSNDYNTDYIISSIDTNILSLTLNHLLLRTTAKDKTIRWRSTSIISSIIKKLHGIGLGLPDELFNSISDHLLLRLNDKITNVRIAAIQATSFIHNFDDSHDLIRYLSINYTNIYYTNIYYTNIYYTDIYYTNIYYTNIYILYIIIRNAIINLMSSDPSKDVRVAAVISIPTTKFALDAIIDRIKDVNSDVRIAALRKLQSDVSIRHLSRENRAMIIQFVCYLLFS
jgi:hypothetical protein